MSFGSWSLLFDVSKSGEEWCRDGPSVGRKKILSLGLWLSGIAQDRPGSGAPIHEVLLLAYQFHHDQSCPRSSQADPGRPVLVCRFHLRNRFARWVSWVYACCRSPSVRDFSETGIYETGC